MVTTMKAITPLQSPPERLRPTADSVSRALVVAEKRRLERLAQTHGVSRKTAAQIANAFFAGVIQPRL